MSSDTWAPGRHWGEEGGTYTLARGSRQASRSRFTSGSSLSFFPSGARGALNTSGTLERAERRAQLTVRGCPGASFRVVWRLGLQHRGFRFLPGPPPRGFWGRLDGAARGLTGSPLAPVSPLLPGAPGSP